MKASSHEGSGYALHDDTSLNRTSGSTGSGHLQQTPLVHRHAAARSSSSGYQPPNAPGAKALNMPMPTTRIMDRDPEHDRSKGRWNIRRQKVDHYWKLYMQDPFHTLVNMRLSKVIAILMFSYIAILMIFGALYMAPSNVNCKTGVNTFLDGFGFSVSTMFTIGFGTNGGDVFFGECVSMQVLITTQSLVAVMLNALAIGVIFQRVARAQSRANTIVLSSTAVVRRVRGNLYFMFQVCEMRKHQLVEAHVRLYAVRHDVEFGQHYYFQSYPMRIQHPDDEINGMLLLALPSVVVHRLDNWSPLLRPKKLEDSCGVHHNPTLQYLFPEIVARQADADNGDRDYLVNIPRTSLCNRCRCDLVDQKPSPPAEELSHEAAIEDIKSYWQECQMEIIVLVEGIDAVTSATIQVRHSFKLEDIKFDHRFENCVDVDPATGGAVIDFKRFHETHPVDPDCVKAGVNY